MSFIYDLITGYQNREKRLLKRIDDLEHARATAEAERNVFASENSRLEHEISVLRDRPLLTEDERAAAEKVIDSLRQSGDLSTPAPAE